jgi:hypothetical protein
MNEPLAAALQLTPLGTLVVGGACVVLVVLVVALLVMSALGLGPARDNAPGGYAQADASGQHDWGGIGPGGHAAGADPNAPDSGTEVGGGVGVGSPDLDAGQGGGGNDGDGDGDGDGGGDGDGD